eukprot:GGOE01044578.1.p1 GENE.GGOE01044578.1~~GGOE01044578.1.p1  ORF type:complete len:361 (-),score=99.66 GGOE01044578.1:174-1256(-)
MPQMSDDYNLHSGRQTILWVDLRHLFAAELPRLPVDPSRPIRVCDYGCSTGRNSLEPLHLVAAECQRRGSPLVWVTLSDLPATDWRATFRTVTPAAIAAAGGPEGEAAPVTAANILVHAAPSSFYEQVMPAGTVDLSYALIATHWLSGIPTPPSAGIIHPALEADPTKRAVWEQHARTDWKHFVELRARELCAGGVLIVATIGRPEGTPFSPTGYICTVSRCLEQMATLHAPELEALLAPVYYRSPSQFAAPFEDPQLGMVVDTVVPVFSPCPYFRALEAKEITVEEFADQLWSFFLGYSEAILKHALRQRPPAESEAIVAELRQRFRQAVCEAPAANKLDYTLVFLAAHKVGAGAGEQR